MTALDQVKGILITASRLNDGGSSSKQSPAVVEDSTTMEKPCLLLKNMRNYYARRRPCMMQTARSACSRPAVISPFKSPTKVRFDDEGTRVHEIPSRHSYSKDEKKKIWTCRAVLKKMMLKNHTEYCWEGRNWRDAVEEDDFITGEDGEKLHPAHAKKVHKKRKVVVLNKQRRKVFRKLPLAAGENQVSNESSSLEEEDDYQEGENKRPRLSSS